METSVYPNLVAFTGIPLRQTINESDRELLLRALNAPATHAAIVVAFDGDEIDKAVKAHPEGLRLVGRFECDRPEPWTVYVSDTPPIVQSCGAVIASAKVRAMSTTLAALRRLSTSAGFSR